MTPKGSVSKTVASSKKQQTNRIYVRLADTSDNDKLQRLKNIVDKQEQGTDEVVLIIGSGEAKQAIRLPQRVLVADGLLTELSEIFGTDNVKR